MMQAAITALLIAVVAGAILSVVLEIVEMLRTRRRVSTFLQGRFISRPLIRLLGLTATRRLRSALGLAYIVSSFTGPHPLYRVLLIAFALWIIDDHFGRRRGGRRRRDWAKSKLRKLKPVKLRPAERWKPIPSPIPIPA